MIKLHLHYNKTIFIHYITVTSFLTKLIVKNIVIKI
jgi:hypothetical protein